MGPEYLRKLLPDLAPETVVNVLARTSYDSYQESEAEAMATFLGELVTSSGARDVTGDSGPDVANRERVLGELTKTLSM